MEDYDKIMEGVLANGAPSEYDMIMQGVRANSNPAMSYDNLFETYETREIQGLDFTNQDYLTGFENPLTRDIEEVRAYRQPWLTKAGTGVGRVGSKVLAEILKMPGTLGGIIAGTAGQMEDWVTGKDNTDFMATAFDNSWINAVQDAEHWVNDEILPVYVKKAVRDGNLWDKLTAIDFWATEGADGLGYVVSMLVPGAVINKFQLGSKLAGISKVARMSPSTEKAIGILGKAGITNKNADLYAATIANTLFESGAEAKSAMDNYEAHLLADLESGKITQEEFDAKIQDKSKVGANVFGANAAILIGPNAVMSKMLWGKPRNRKLSDKLFDKDNFQKLVTPSIARQAKLYGDDFGKAALREGFWEEGMQSTAENYFVENPSKNLGDFIGDFSSAYIEMLGTTEGQTAIALGAAYGGGMQAYMGGRARKAERKATNALIEGANNMFSSLYTVFDADVDLLDKDGKPMYYTDEEGVERKRKDLKKVVEKLQSNDALEALSLQYDLAVEQGDMETIEQIKDIVYTHVVKPFIVNDSLGVDALEQYLNQSEQLANISEKEGTSNADFIRTVINKAQLLKQKYNNFQDFAPKLIKLNEEGTTKEEQNDFLQKLAMQYVDHHSRKEFLERKKVKKDQELNALIAEKGRTREEYDSNQSLQRDLRLDSRIGYIGNQVDAIRKSLEQVNKTLEAFWDGKTPNDYFKKEIREKRELERKRQELEAKVDSKLKEIKAAKTMEDLDSIDNDIDDADTKAVIDEAIKSRKEEINKDIQTAAERAKAASKAYDDDEATQAARTQEENEYIANNFNVGEIINLPNSNESGVIDEITEEGVTVTKENGEQVVLPSAIFFENRANYSANFNTEGAPTSTNEETTRTVDETHDNRLEDKNDSSLITDQAWNDPAALEFERNPRDKRGEQKHVAINDNPKLTGNLKKALDMYKANDFSDIEFLIKYLPLDIMLTDSVRANTRTYSDRANAEKYNEIWEKSDRWMRTAIIKELAINKVPISDITVPIVGQKGGQIQIAPKENGQVVENNVADLYEFGGDVNNISPTDIYVVNDVGRLVNINGDELYANRKLAKGEIYIGIKTANGNPFPLKLNVAKIKDNEAELLYELYKYRIQDVKNNTKSKRLSTIDKALLEQVKEVFGEQIKLLGKDLDDITIKDITDFFIWDGTQNPKSQVRFYEGDLKVGGSTYAAELFNTEEAKNHFISTITDMKRHNIRFKKKGNEDKVASLEDRSYLDYLINNKILNTNAVVGEHTFQGDTKLFVGSDQIKVNGELSQFNKDIPQTFTELLVGNNNDLQNMLPQLFKRPVTLTPDGEFYIDEDGNKFARASTLKESDSVNAKGDNVLNASVRGDVVDELTRIFFSSPLPRNEFIKRANIIAEEVNKRKGRDVIITNDYFNSLFDILEEYKLEFNRRGWTIYSNTPSLSGKIGKLGLFAGTVDLLAYDNNTKEWIIIDLKTTTRDRGEYYDGTVEDVWGYKSNDRIQQNAYRELFKQKTGNEISKLFIMPITSKGDNKINSIYSDVQKNKSGLLLEVNMARDIYSLKNIEEKEENEGKPSFDTQLIDESLQDPTQEENAGEVVEEIEGQESGLDWDLINAAAGVEEKKKPEPIQNKPFRLTSKHAKEITAELEANNTFTVIYKGQNIIVTRSNYYFIVEKESRPITDMATIKDILNNHTVSEESAIIGKKGGHVIPISPLNSEKAKIIQTWTNRLNAKEQKVENKVAQATNELNLNNLTEQELLSVMNALIQNYKTPANNVDFIQLLQKNKNAGIKDKVQAIVNYLVDKNVSKEEIKTKCGI